MKFSIVTISYNQARFLRQCIGSVLEQDHTDIEYFIVDPGSTDGSRDIIKSYGSRVIPIFEKDSGPADGLNRGFARASGDIFCFINADDYLLPRALSVVDAHFRAWGLSHFVSGEGYIEEQSGSIRRIRPSQIELLPLLYGACTVFQPGTFFPKTMFRQVGGFNAENRTCWDGELFMKFVAAGHTHRVIDTRLAVFRLHGDSITGSGRLRTAYEADLQRLFGEHMGRQPVWHDGVLRGYFRILKNVKKIGPLVRKALKPGARRK